MLPMLPRTLLLALLTTVVADALAVGAQSEVDLWETLLRPQYFQNREIALGKEAIELRIPLRAEDAGVVPVSIDAKHAQTAERYIQRLFVFVDKNPKPLAGVFTLTPEMGEADLALRLRINQFTKVRVVAEMNTGELYMDEGYTRASGGCSEPPPFLQLKEARARIGEMQFRTTHDPARDGALGQLMIRHPNITGMQLDQRTRAYIPADYVTQVVIHFNGQHIMTAETDISISEDPSFRFFFQPQKGGTLEARMTDSEGRSFTHTFKVDPSPAPG
jgi:sulfur-oxidizing protein SoxY